MTATAPVNAVSTKNSQVHPRVQQVPEQASGEFETASGHSPVAGEGQIVKFKVEVEKGVRERPDRFARIVEKLLFDRRSWAGRSNLALQRVDTGVARFKVTLATPNTVDKNCRPLKTNGLYSCWNGNRVMVNLWRWYAGDRIFSELGTYRAHLINHEVGHALGYGHQNQCPGEGRPAPIMMQQTIDLDGCKPTSWVNSDKSKGYTQFRYARVLDEPITYKQIKTKQASSGREQNLVQAEGIERYYTVDIKDLHGIITRFLYYDFIDRNQLEASHDEVQAMKTYLRDRVFWVDDDLGSEMSWQRVVTHWKFKQTLFRRYGGTTVSGIFGYEPLQAYRKFMRDEKRQGRYSVFIPKLLERFQKMSPAVGIDFSTPARREQSSESDITLPWDVPRYSEPFRINGK